MLKHEGFMHYYLIIYKVLLYFDTTNIIVLTTSVKCTNKIHQKGGRKARIPCNKGIWSKKHIRREKNVSITYNQMINISASKTLPFLALISLLVYLDYPTQLKNLDFKIGLYLSTKINIFSIVVILFA